MSYESAQVVVPSAAVTTSGTGGGFVVPGGSRLSVWVNATAAAGTPSVVLTLQWSMDGGDTWAVADPPDVFTAITGVGCVVKDFTRKGDRARLVWAVTGGTPSLTFEARAQMTAGA